MGIRYGYARVSSKGQQLYGTSLLDQEETLIKAGAQVVFKDTYTGTTTNRPEFEKLLSVLESGDTLIVTKMDRLGRRAVDILEVISHLLSKNVSVNILNMGVCNNTAFGRLMVTMMGAFAEFERDTIVERLHAGKAFRAEQRAKVGAVSPFQKVFIEESKITKVLNMVMSGRISQRRGCQILGVGHNYFNRIIKQRGLEEKYQKQMELLKERKELLKIKAKLGQEYLDTQHAIWEGKIEDIEIREDKAADGDIIVSSVPSVDVEGYDLLSAPTGGEGATDQIIYDSTIYDAMQIADIHERDSRADENGIINDLEEDKSEN